RDLHSFPTRRSSDLSALLEAVQQAHAQHVDVGLGLRSGRGIAQLEAGIALPLAAHAERAVEVVLHADAVRRVPGHLVAARQARKLALAAIGAEPAEYRERVERD